MTDFSPSEKSMWAQQPPARPRKLTNDEINAKYARREWRIVTESNREQLPNFVEALRRQGWMELRPFYQRRPRWDSRRQSRLIESFIMNVPVPPLFVYEADLAKYEVMDGQQRITAIRDFYANELKLTGLEQWPELNGRTYKRLPSEIRKGLDRRSISYTVLLKESAETSEEQTLLRQLVFERLNTGGVKLSQQEVRNCLYQGPFNSMLVSLARLPAFRTAWRLPQYSMTEEQEHPPEQLLTIPFYVKMTDVEVVLRFFALRHSDHYQRGMQGFLDLYMVRARSFTDDDLVFLRELFADTIALAVDLYGDNVFRPWQPKKKTWAAKPHRAFSDAVMVGLSKHLESADLLRTRATRVIKGTQQLFEQYEETAFTGSRNTKADVQDRIRLFDDMLKSVIGD